MRSMTSDIQFIWSYPLASFGHVQNFERTQPDKDVRRMSVTRALVCSLSGSHAVCPVLIHSAFFIYPVCICRYPFDPSCERSTAGQVIEFRGRILHGHSLIVQRTFCPFFIRYIFVVSFILPLHVG